MLFKKYNAHDSVQDKQMFLKESFCGMVCYAMLSYGLVWFGKYGMLWNVNAILWDFYAMLCYGLCCKRQNIAPL